jgi:hypothetical protein
MSIQNYNVYEGLTSVRLVSTVNIAGTYNNGPLNNGIGSFLTINSSTFSVDLKEVNIGDDLLLIGQTNTNENGIYTCIQTGGIYSFSAIQRRPDFHAVEQMRSGQYISVGDGTISQGSMYCLVTPLPIIIGVSPINFVGTSPSIQNFTINTPDLTPLADAKDFVALTGQVTNFTVPFHSITPIANNYSQITINGLTEGFIGADITNIIGNAPLNGQISGTTNFFEISGVLSGQLFLTGSFFSMDLSNATVNGDQIYGQWIGFQTNIGTPNDITNVIGQVIANETGIALQTFQLFSGDASYLFQAEGASTYYTTAGTGAGQAGDPTHCNAQVVLTVKINGSNIYIPGFQTNS